MFEKLTCMYSGDNEDRKLEEKYLEKIPGGDQCQFLHGTVELIHLASPLLLTGGCD